MPHTVRNAAFEDVFDWPPNANMTPQPRDAFRDLEECVRIYQARTTPNNSPLQRWLHGSLNDEGPYVDCVHMTRMNNSHDAHQIASRSLSVAPTHPGSASSSVNTRQQNTTQATPPRHENSWLDLDEINSESDRTSHSASDVSTPRYVTPDLHMVEAADMVRSIISTFGTLG